MLPINSYKKASIVWSICLFLLASPTFSMTLQKKDTVINLLTNDTSLKPAETKIVYEVKNHTSKKSWLTTPALPEDIADSIASTLLAENEVYQEHWSNDYVFVYANFNYLNLPETIKIPLIKAGQKFQLTWYGNLNYKYGMRWGRMHKGLDLFLRTGDSVVSAFEGIVRYAQYNTGGFGNCVVVRHTNGLETVYGHLSKIMVDENQYVQGGETVGLGGTTGNSSGPHLHFETRYKDFTINPEMYFDVQTGQLIGDELVLKRTELSPQRYPSASYTKAHGKRKRYGSRLRGIKKYGKNKGKYNAKNNTKKVSKKAGTKKIGAQKSKLISKAGTHKSTGKALKKITKKKSR